MTDLFDYFGRNVTIIDSDGTKWQGYAAAYTSAIDNENGEEELAVRTDKGVIGFCSSDITAIQAEWPKTKHCKRIR